MRNVTWDKSRRRWVATFNHNGQVRSLGRFKKKSDAVAAVKEKKLELALADAWAGDVAESRRLEALWAADVRIAGRASWWNRAEAKG